MLSWFIASIHLIALGIGLGAISIRALALRGNLQIEQLPRVFLADTLWGIAALLWISTGLWRAFGGLGKGTDYYLVSHAFHAKMGLLVLILLLELWPMITLIRWRIARMRGQSIDLAPAATMGRISMVQAVLVVGMVFAATAMARGIGV